MKEVLAVSLEKILEQEAKSRSRSCVYDSYVDGLSRSVLLFATTGPSNTRFKLLCLSLSDCLTRLDRDPSCCLATPSALSTLPRLDTAAATRSPWLPFTLGCFFRARPIFSPWLASWLASIASCHSQSVEGRVRS